MGWPYPLVRWVRLWNRPSVGPLLPLPEDVGYQINQSLCGGNRDIGIVEAPKTKNSLCYVPLCKHPNSPELVTLEWTKAMD